MEEGCFLNKLPAVAVDPEVSDSTPLSNFQDLTIKPKSLESRTNTNVCGSSSSSSFVPSDPHMAKILDLLRVDLDAIDDKVNGNAKQKKGRAKVDRNWISNLPKSRKSKNVFVSSTFVPSDPHMAKILDLLRVDLDAIDDKVNGSAKQKKGLAKVDRKWISNLLRVDWSNAFTEEGHLRVPDYLHLLPKMITRTDAHSSLWISYRRLKSAALGLADYNKRNEGDEYYLVKPITAQPARKEGEFVSHANFLAKRKNDSESPVELFFAEVFYVSDVVTICCRLEPRLYPPDIIPPLENAIFSRKRVVHAEGFSCLTCDREGRRYL